MLGDEIAKPTRIRAWGIKLPSLSPVCAWFPSRKRFSCGRTKENPHVLLSTNKPGGKRMSTWSAAAYQPGTVAAWAQDIADRNREILANAPKPELPQTAPVLSSMEEALEALFPDACEPSTPLCNHRSRSGTARHRRL